jgi:lysostaphin
VTFRNPTRSSYSSRYGYSSQRGGGIAGLVFVLVALTLALFILSRMTGWDAPSVVWWLTNTNPPSIVLNGPTGPVRGAVQIDAQLAPADRSSIVAASIDGQPITLTTPLVVDTAAVPDGAHRITMQAADGSRLRNKAEAELTLRSDNTPPRLNVELNSGALDQGGTLSLKVRADEPSTTVAMVDGKRLSLQREADFDWALVGFGPDTPPHASSIVVRGTDELGNAGEQTTPFEVAPRQFTQDRVQVSQRLAALLEPHVRAEEDAHLAPTYARVSGPRLWSGRFAQPVQGTIVTEFGEVRSYNGGPFEGHHGGVDFAANTGTPVLAPARGVVALVDQVPLRGNVVILDHGLGVFTTYAHLSSVDTKLGDTVQPGQAFARVGTTGLSEGPHLHWELWIGGQNVDPMPWTQRAFP